MGLRAVGNQAQSNKILGSYVLVETSSVGDGDASITLTYYENGTQSDTVTKIYNQVSSAFTFHHVTLRYSSQNWYLGTVSAYGPYGLADSKVPFESMITSSFSSTSWGYKTSVEKIVYPSEYDISQVAVGYLQSVFGGQP